METLAQEWIEEGKSIGFDLGKKEGIDIGKKEGIDIGKKEGIEVARRQMVHAMLENGFAEETIARLLNTSEAEVKQLLENSTANHDSAPAENR